MILFRLSYYPCVVLQLALLNWSFVVVEAQQDPCVFSRWRYQAVSHDSACICDANATLCQPNDLCLSFRGENYVSNGNATTGGIEDYSQYVCLPIPCDDISGTWIWVGGNAARSDFYVYGTVKVHQNKCHAVVTVETNTTLTTNDSNFVDTSGTRTATFYSYMTWREVYYLNLFTSAGERAAYESYDGDEPPESVIPNNAYSFVQNFESSAPQCVFFGSFVTLGLEADVPLTFGSLTRDVDATYSIGDAIPLSVLGVCPEGYPRQWTETNDMSPPLPPSPAPTPSPLAPPTVVPTEAPTALPESTMAPAAIPESAKAPTAMPESTKAPTAMPESTKAPTAASLGADVQTTWFASATTVMLVVVLIA
jgi:hypothetical protein